MRKRTGRTRWSSRNAENWASTMCPVCEQRRVTEAMRTNHDALTWGAMTEVRLHCGHIVARNGTVVA